MSKYYFLMHENIQLAIVEINDYGNISKLKLSTSDIAQSHLPILPFSPSVSVESKLVKWIQHRGIPATRQGIKRDLDKLNESPFSYMVENLGLSLTDHYWLKPYESSYTWETINLYTNDFRAVCSLNLDDDIKSIAGKTNFVPSASLKGDLRKKWIIGPGGTRFLVKGNSGNTIRQSLNEVLATEIHRRQGRFEYTPYSLIRISSNGIETTGCICQNFTSIETEFIPAIDIVNSVKKRNDENYYDAYLRVCGEYGIDIDYLRAFMEYQILTDFVISNTDRHLNNFGVIRDSKTLKFIKPAPIFDSGNSMFYKGRIYTDYGLLNLEVSSFANREVQLLKYVMNPMLINLSALPSEKEVLHLFMLDEFERKENTLKLAKAYSKKIQYLHEFQSGVKIYSYQYLKNRGGITNGHEEAIKK